MSKEFSKEMMQAQEEIPTAFFENRWFIYTLYGGLFAATTAAYFANYQNLGVDIKDEKDIFIRIASVVVLTVGALMDKYSSVRLSEPNQESWEHGIGVYKELNPFVSDIPRKEEFTDLKNPINLMELPSPVLAAIAPYFGLAAGLARGFAALSNERKTERVKRAIEIKKES